MIAIARRYYQIIFQQQSRRLGASMKGFIVLWSFLGTFSSLCWASASDPKHLTSLDDSIIGLPHSSGMAHATIACPNGIEAIYQNPAAIGGLDGQKLPIVSQLEFPYASLSINSNSSDLMDQFKAQGGSDNSAIGTAIIQAHTNTRQYGRFALMPNIIIKRMAIVPIVDQQLAATAVDASTDNVYIHARTTTGLGIGTAISGNKGGYYFGIFTANVNVTEIDGLASYANIISTENRSAALKDITAKYSGTRTNVGLLFKLGRKHDARLAIVARDLATSKLQSEDNPADSLAIPENLSIGMAFHKKINSSSGVRYTFQADRLSQTKISVIHKPRAGFEIYYGKNSNKPAASLRMGSCYSGISGGIALSLGLLGLQASTYLMDVGATNDLISERRYDLSVRVELVEF
jgi:hypothetical protein